MTKGPVHAKIMEHVLGPFFYGQKPDGSIGENAVWAVNTEILTEVKVVRTKITLECTECKNRNYNMTKDKKEHPERMETKKYCRFCRKHTMHKETK